MDGKLNKTATIKKIYAFLQAIGIKVIEKEIRTSTFLPGLRIEQGTLCVDREQLKYPGDILHEAGHIALETPSVRAKLSGNVLENEAKASEGTEIAIHLWSYLACQKIGISPKVVFHKDGYKGDADWLISQFENGNYIGQPLLVWMDVLETHSPLVIKNWVRP